MLPGLVQQSPGVSQDYVQAAATGGMLPMPSPQVAPHAAALPVLPRGVASPADESLSVALLMQQVEAFRAQLAQFTDALQDQRQALMFEAQERRELAELLCSERNEREQAIQSVMDSLQAERDQLTAGIRQLRRELQLECDIRAEEARQLNASICASRGDKSASSCTQLGVAGCAGDTSAFPKATSGGIPTPAELSLATAPGTAPVAAGVALDSAACAQPDVSGSRHDMEDRYLASAEAAQAGVHQGALAPEAASAVSARAQHECLRRVMQQPQQPQQPQQHVQQVHIQPRALAQIQTQMRPNEVHQLQPLPLVLASPVQRLSHRPERGEVPSPVSDSRAVSPGESFGVRIAAAAASVAAANGGDCSSLPLSEVPNTSRSASGSAALVGSASPSANATRSSSGNLPRRILRGRAA